MSDVSRCPFCGSDAFTNSRGQVYWQQCQNDNCNAEGPTRFSETASVSAWTARHPVEAGEVVASITDKQFDEIIGENVIGGTDDFPSINRASLLADLSAAMDALQHGNALAASPIHTRTP